MAEQKSNKDMWAWLEMIGNRLTETLRAVSLSKTALLILSSVVNNYQSLTCFMNKHQNLIIFFN